MNEHEKNTHRVGNLLMLVLVSREHKLDSRGIRKQLRAAIAVCRASADQLNAELRDLDEGEEPLSTAQ
ncbi:MAG: hypothetical protein E6Q97_19220 [Desulfurellales bacterium]|nr:MAG: hypothetical protein E6Q97_19220 [Desulfurellales bacterium]